MALILSGDAGITFPVVAGSASAVQASSGRVLQVVSAFLNGGVSTTSTSLVATGLTATITPTTATSKILIMVSHNAPAKGAVASTDFGLSLYKNGSSLQRMVSDGLNTGSSSQLYGTSQSFTHVDSPATTSATTYATFFQNNGGSSNTINIQTDNGTIVLMEIAA
jgi:hypothetical protein